jgi:hypothetical protein
MNRDYEDGLYRFYHQSLKVYSLQAHTTRAAGLIRAIAGEAGRRTEYGRELDVAPTLLPSGWAAVLSLFGLR